MSSTDNTPEGRREALAEQRGRDVAMMENRFKANELEISYLKKGNAELKEQVRKLTEQVSQLASDFTAHLKVGEAVQDQVAKNSAEQVTKKTYILGLLGAVFALGMLLVATLALLYGSR